MFWGRDLPSIIGSVPDAKAGPLLDYLQRARGAGVQRLDYNELLGLLLVAVLEADNG